jgi:hypothetical protein
MYRFHLGHKYHVEGVKSSATFPTEPTVDFSKMKTAGYSSMITYIIERVFAPRKFSAELCNHFGKWHLHYTYNISIYNFTGLQFIRVVILYGPPGTGKTSLLKYGIEINEIFLFNHHITLFYRSVCEYFNLQSHIIHGPQLLN